MIAQIDLQHAGIIAHGGGRRGPAFQVSYEFQDGSGVTFHGTARLSRKTWSRLQAGDSLRVEYVQLDPTKNRPVGMRGGLWAGIVLAFVGVAALVGGIALLRRTRSSIVATVSLLKSGEPVLGLIDEKRWTRPRKGSPFLTVIYRYCFAGARCSPAVQTGELTLTGRVAIQFDTRDFVLVVVNREQPDWHMVDIFGIREDDLNRLMHEK